MTKKITFKIEFADVREFVSDILVLKYAQGNYGVDRIISYDLNQNGIDLKKISPKIGKSVLIDNIGTSKFSQILFIGVPHLAEFGYAEIRKFSATALAILKDSTPNIERVTMTIHGVGYGLDENEAILSEFAGIFDGIQSGNYPDNLTEIIIIENNHERLIRLGKTIDNHLKLFKPIKKNNADNSYFIEINTTKKNASQHKIDKSINVGKASEKKKHIFVAMPFKDEMTDTFYYGIQQPINNNDFLCERIDQDIFTGDVLTKIKNKIETSSAVVADLTTQNPNVYLEVGYAWGIGKPTIFLINEADKLRFDVQGYRCLQYKSIKHLEEILTKEIKGLKESGEIQ